MNINTVEKNIIENELKLLEKNIRNNKEELKKLISNDFIEFGSSGSIYTFFETIDLLPRESKEINYRIITMETKILSKNIIMVLYTIEINTIITNRCSIWQNKDNEWKIIFHQGTKAKE